MSLTAGSMTCRCYCLEDPPPKTFLANVERDMKRHAFRPVQVERSPRSWGWVNAQNVLDTDLTLEKIRFDDFLVFGLRVDRVTVNGRLLKAHVAAAIEKALRQRERKTLSRDERTAFVEKVRLDLMAKQMPLTGLYDAAWSLKTHHVYFSATGDALNQEFCDLFSDTFHTALTPLFPFLRAERKAKSEGLVDELLATMPVQLSPQYTDVSSR